MQRQIKRFRGERNRGIHRWTDRYRQTDRYSIQRKKNFNGISTYQAIFCCGCL